MYEASRYNILAKIRLSSLTGRVCDALAPKGAITKLHRAMINKPGSQMYPNAPAGKLLSFQPLTM